ncbi:MAG: sensor histidine kinase [Chitinophagaceae bacterium]|nr:sensor histidine kinase [Chitinophagaceae bacterium]
MLRQIKALRFCLPFLLAITIICPDVTGQMSNLEIDSLARTLATAKEDTNKVNLLMTLGNEIGYTDQNKAMDYARQGYALSNKLNFPRGIARTAYLTALTYMDLGDYNLSDSFLSISEQRFRQIGDQRGLAKISNGRGSRHYMTGNYWLSASFYSKAAEEFDALKDTTNSLVSYQNLISVLGQINNHERAAVLGKKVLVLAEERKDSLQIGYTMQGLVNNLLYSDKLDEAANYIDRLTEIGNTTRDHNLAPEIFSTIGTYFYKREAFPRAITYFNMALENADKLNNKYQLANHYNSAGQAYYRMGDFSNSRKNLTLGMDLARRYENRRAESNIALSLSSLYDSLHDYPSAYSNLLVHARMKDSLLNSETRTYTSQLEAQYESNKKENEILRLQKVEQEKDFQIKKRNTYLGIGIGLVAALIAVLYLLKRNYRNRQKLSEQQAALLKERIKTIEKEQQISSLQSMINGQETERTRIARDLHDGLGGIFSTVKMHYSTLPQDTPGIKENPMYRKTLDLINNASDELRKVAHNMMPEVLMKVGLVDALRDFANNISSGKLLKVTLQTFGMEKRLGNATEIMLYRIIQELVNNIIKHAHATEAIIQINREGNRLSLTIEDNGRGFDTREAEEKRSMGMDTVKSRVNYLNGKLTIDSRKDIGTTVMIDLLLNEN